MASLDESIVFTFTWTIENIDLYEEEMDAELASPSFQIGTIDCTELQIYLNSGEWSTKHIWPRVLKYPEKREHSYKAEITLLRADGEVIEHFSTCSYLFCGHAPLYENPILFSNERVLSHFLQKKSLTIRWKVYSMASGECFFRTVFHQKIFRWNIDDFSKRPTFRKLCQFSSLYLTIDLSKLQQIPLTKVVKIEITPSNEDRLQYGNCTLAAVEKTSNTKYIIYDYGSVDILYNKSVLIKRGLLIEPAYKKNMSSSWEAPVMLNEGVCKLIKNDTLILECQVTVAIRENWNGYEPQIKREITTTPTKGNIDRRGIAEMSPTTMQSDMLRLYEERKFCDATLNARTSSFPVHKNVLCARSSVFCAMFESDTEEGRTGVVHVLDVEPDTLDKMLLFLYTDSLGDITWEMAAGL